MRYRVVNLGGMLEDYQDEINRLKDKLNKGGYSQSGPNIINQPPPSPPPAPKPRPLIPGGLEPPESVATGYPTPPPPPLPPPPPMPPAQPCGPNETWTVDGCLPNVESEDRWIRPLPERPLPPPPPPEPPLPTPPPSVATGWNPGPQPPPPPPFPEPFQGPCPPGTTWTPSGCLPDVATPGGGGMVFPGGFFPGGLFSGSGTSAVSLMGRLPYSGAPLLLRSIRLRGY